ncbi:MAG: hypothetical protein Q7S42_05830, partial [Candidatus Omnitrophota bacterium]|nr:hypothetical protein [Candidatus Omnitrophota bacterium]
NVESDTKQKLQEVDRLLSNIVVAEKDSQDKLTTIEQSKNDADNKKSQIEELRVKTEELLSINTEQSHKVSDILQKAAAGSLFNSFNLRKGEHQKASNFWIWMVGISVVILFGIALWLAWIVHTKGVLSYEFLVKFSVSFPFVYWLAFSTRQFTKSKRLEEEYAFKSAISLSLEAYRDLIKKESGELTKSDVIPFITEAVGKIFSSPNIAISKYPHKDDGEDFLGNLVKLKDIIAGFKG